MGTLALTGRKVNADEGDPGVGSAERDSTAERAPGSVFGWTALASTLRVVDVTTAVVVMAGATAMVHGNTA